MKADERRCPFCKAHLSDQAGEGPGLPTVRLSRAALFAFGTSLAAASGAAAACGGGTTTDRADADVGSVDAAYGGPPIRDSGGDADAGDAPDDVGTVQGAYGPPAVDASND